MFALLQVYLLALITVALLVVEVYALIDALRRTNEAFVSAGKRTKSFWAILLAVGAALGFVGVTPPLGLGLLGLAALFAVIPALIYLSDVRPALGGHRRPRKQGPSSPRGGW